LTFVEVAAFWFFPLAFALHWALPRRAGWQNGMLLALSWLFYALWSPALLGVLVLSTAFDYGIVRAMGSRPEGNAPPSRRRTVLLVASIAVNVGLLIALKYRGFFLEGLAPVFAAVGLRLDGPTAQFVVPVGLSFYTLIKIGAVVDVFDGRVPPARSFVRFAVFAGFFANVVAGPITRAGDFLPQLHGPRRLTPAAFATGAWLFFHGYVLKALVADRFGHVHVAGDGRTQGLVDPVFADPSAFDAVAHHAALLGYAVQLYCDFAGYSLMAMGIARLFGIVLPRNFDLPYLSRSLPELWRRWHITLNTWLFDYVYTPLCTGRTWFRGRVAACLMVVFLTSGLWHGAAWTFVLWGALHGLGMAVHHGYDQVYKGLCRRNRVWVQRRRSRPYAVASWALTQAFFVVTLVPFRAPDLTAQNGFFAGLVGAGGARGVEVGSTTNAAILALCLGVFLWHHGSAWGPVRRLQSRFFGLPAPLRGVAYGLALVVLALFVPIGEGTFVYQNF